MPQCYSPYFIKGNNDYIDLFDTCNLPASDKLIDLASSSTTGSSSISSSLKAEVVETIVDKLTCFNSALSSLF